MIIHMMPKRKIQRTPKGQWTITIPKDWEDILKLKPKDHFEWIFVDRNTLELKRVIKKKKKNKKRV